MDNEKQEKELHFKILSVTGCAAGIAHTFMAAEGIERGAKELGHEIKVETHGTAGPENVFTAKEIRDADVILIAADITVNLDRFVGKKVYVTTTNLAITDPEKLINNAISGARTYKVTMKGNGNQAVVQGVGDELKKSYFVRHLMYAIGWMVPVVIAAGLVMALGNIRAMQPGWIIPSTYSWSGEIMNTNAADLATSTIYINGDIPIPDDIMAILTAPNYWSITNLGDYVFYTDADGNVINESSAAEWGGLPPGSEYGKVWSFYERGLAATLFSTGAAGMNLIYPIIAAAIAFSLAGKISFAPAFLGGWLMNDGNFLGTTIGPEGSETPIGTGFIGAILVGFFVGYMAILFKKIVWPKPIKGIANLMILPFVMLLITAIMCKYVFGEILQPVITGLYAGLNGLDSLSGGELLLGAVVAGMIAFDLGGPINKTALVFGTMVFLATVNLGGSPDTWNFVPGTATQAAISVPPLAAFFSVTLFPKYFNRGERTLGTNASVMGCVGITEGAIPFAIAKPKVFVPANVIGGMIAGTLVTAFGFQFYGGLGSPLAPFLGYVPSTVFSENYMLGAFVWAFTVIFAALVATSIIYLGMRLTFKNQQSKRISKELKMEIKKENKGLKKEIKKLKEEEVNSSKNNEAKINELLQKIANNKDRVKEAKSRIKKAGNENFSQQKGIFKEKSNLENEKWDSEKNALKEQISAYKKSSKYQKEKEQLTLKNQEIKEQFSITIKATFKSKEYSLSEKISELWKNIKGFLEDRKKAKLLFKYYQLKAQYKVADRKHKDNLGRINDLYLRGIA